ncbi:MAG TPA: hypothetical protein VJN29_10460 [Intrasporangium sp.]|uniref:hypothetical protein n=1 Tax=Intrasporangium sp. TaxID=1925024 RepID=UPI002B48EF9D|nr:hypothetical protein [Intrasporangium sp.]HKX67636.1 hypothetical protein [Intrasporangium sp.]
MKGCVVALMGAALLLALPAPMALADGPPCGIVNCGTNNDNAYVELLSREEVLALPAYPGDNGAPRPEGSPYFEYVSLPDCPANHPQWDQEIMCGRALRQCPPELEGNTRLRIWRQLVTPPDDRGPWEAAGVTCYSDVAPGARPQLTMADIKAAFMRTPWAKPTISTQPQGDVTLVNLETFYRVTWSSAGYEPDEADRRVLRGIPVSIRPKLVGFTYHFGDGGTYGPTDSLGGVYPDGDVVHTYREPGEFTTRVTTTFGADFSLDGGASWDAIPATVDVPGPSTTVTVREAKAVLVTR